MEKIKTVLSFLCYPMTMAHYFWEAFGKREDVELFTLGPFSDSYIPWSGGMQLPKKYVKVPDLALPISQSQFMPSYSYVKPYLPWKPDLWVQIDAGWHFSDRPDAGIVAHVQTDPHVLKEQYRKVRQNMDFVFCMQSPYIDWGEIYLPYAYSPEIHYYEDREKIYDACLIGLHYEQRNALVNRLRARGLNVYYSIGEVYDLYRQKYNESKVALSWSSLKDLPARCWEAWGMKQALVTNRVPDLKLFANEGEHYLGFDTVDEAEQQVMMLIEDEKFRLDMAQRGHDNIKTETWDRRVEIMLEKCGLL